MEIKVRAVEDHGEKSVQEVEQELLEKHEQQLEASSGNESVNESSPESTTSTQEQKVYNRKVKHKLKPRS